MNFDLYTPNHAIFPQQVVSPVVAGSVIAGPVAAAQPQTVFSTNASTRGFQFNSSSSDSGLPYNDGVPAHRPSVVGSLLSKGNVFAIVCAFLVGRAIAITIYRLYFHPLARFPGPKKLAVTKFYEFYYDVINNNEFPGIVDALHEKYGPIVRIGPHELSINDKDFHPRFFSKDQALRKDPWWYEFGFENALFTTLDQRKHRERKQHMLNLLRVSGSYFTGFHPLFAEKVGALRRTITDAAGSKAQINVSMMLRKTTNDIMRELMLGELCYHSTDHAEDAETKYHPLFRYMSCMRHFNFLRIAYRYIPSWFFVNFSPMAQYMREAELGLRPLLHKYEDMDPDAKETLSSDMPKPVMYALVEGTSLYAEGDYQTAIEEFLELFWAGREAIGAAMTTIAYHMMINPECMTKLHEELRDAGLDLETASYAQLRTLPYLDSVCREGLRVLEGNENRAPRISSEPVAYGEWVVPADYPISASPAFTHRNAEVFPEPQSFRPERWIDNPDIKEMERCWNPFGYGVRACGGRAVTYEVIWRSVANIFAQHSLQFDGIDAQSAWDGGALKVFPNGNAACITATVSKT